MSEMGIYHQHVRYGGVMGIAINGVYLGRIDPFRRHTVPSPQMSCDTNPLGLQIRQHMPEDIMRAQPRNQHRNPHRLKTV